MKKVIVRLGRRSYPVLIGTGLIGQTGARIRSMGIGRDAAIITNSRIKRLFGSKLARSLKRNGISSAFEIVPDSEKSKSSGVYMNLLSRIARRDVLKKPFVIALGGGVVGDLAGFVAATYKRGIPLVQIPTTFLGQVDSAIGGKVAIDLPCAKNLVGAFYQPRLVISDVTALSSLPGAALRSGIAEVIKYGVIKDARLFSFVEKSLSAIMAGNRESLEHIVHRCSAIKADVVSRDERDTKGVRAVLNYGHTAGHAIEAAAAYSKRYSHGEAVAIGMVVAASIARKMRLLSGTDFDRIRALITAAGLPDRVRGLELSAIQRSLMRDKKFIRGVPRFVLPAGIGRVRVVEYIRKPLIRMALKEGMSGVYN